MNAPLRIGMLGCGRMADAMAAAIARDPGTTLAAVAARRPEAARAFAARHGAGAAHDSPAALCADAAIDLVYIATPTASHAALSIAALEAGRAVLCEKPFALTRAEGAAVLAAAQASGAFFMEAMWLPLLPAVRALHARLAAGDVGAARHLSFSFGYPVHGGDLARLDDPAQGGVLFDRGCYGVALALHLLGPARDLQTAVTPGAAALQMRHAGGAVAQIAVSATALLANRADLACTAGSLALEPPVLGAEGLVRRGYAAAPMGEAGSGAGGLRGAVRETVRAMPAARRLRDMMAGVTGGGGRTRHPYGADLYAPMLRHVAEAVRAGARASAVVTPSLSLETVTLLERAASQAAGAGSADTGGGGTGDKTGGDGSGGIGTGIGTGGDTGWASGRPAE